MKTPSHIRFTPWIRQSIVLALVSFTVIVPALAAPPSLKGSIVDSVTGDILAARLYIQSGEGTWHHAQSASDQGGAVPYAVRRSVRSSEIHTSLTAHPFTAELPPGKYTLMAERGKEYHPAQSTISIGDEPVTVTLALRRWTDMASRGWYSGETHVHRTVAELPTLLLAEDLNVALPLTAWVTDSRAAPSESNKNPDPVPLAALIEVDPTHVIWPINTEYEIFSVAGKTHTLGAVFILNHKQPFNLTAPPVKPIAEEARRQGAMLDLDKHNWPWSMMLMPNMGVHLFELTNNHVWRTHFLYTDWYPEYVGQYMHVERVNGQFTEAGWIDFGFQNYYALLNCGFDMKPTAGTASGVHPVPLGFGRVYVKITGAFGYDKWIEGLSAGRSFVTTGPMLMVEINEKDGAAHVEGLVESASPLGAVEIVTNGEIAQSLSPQPEKTPSGAYRFRLDSTIPLKHSSWIAVRVFEQREDQRPRFAHSAPVHIKIDGAPLQPKKVEVEYLMQRVADEWKRHEGILDSAALQEYRDAHSFYARLLERAK